MIKRENYLQTLINFKDKEVIKIITGIRRCGKSTIFELYKEYLLKNKIDKKQIIHINLEDYDYDFITSAKELHEYIKSLLNENEMNYIFIDEVQKIPEFQKAVDSLFIKSNCDIYLTGSNAYLLSGELATLLSGRCIEIKMLPLSFKEYLTVFKEDNVQKLFSNYLRNSSFPYTIQLENSNDRKLYLDNIVDSILIKDILSRGKFPDVEMLKSVLRFCFSNIGNLTSANNIANTMTSNGRKITVNTVENYLKTITDSYIFYEAKRYDIKGKQYLKTGSKYYACDIGLRFVMLGSNLTDMGSIIENIVYIELIRRGYEVYIGKTNEFEVDFVAMSSNETKYYQVSYTVADESTLKRELKSLQQIKDHNQKFLLTMDYSPNISYDGIKQLNILEWLIDDKL